MVEKYFEVPLKGLMVKRALYDTKYSHLEGRQMKILVGRRAICR